MKDTQTAIPASGSSFEINLDSFSLHYKAIVGSLTKYMGMASLLVSLYILSKWNLPEWHIPYTLIVWFLFIAFNLGWTKFTENISEIIPYEHFRISINYCFVAGLFFLTGGSASNFWFPAVTCTIGSSTTLFLATGRIGWHAPANLVLYGALFLWDSGFSAADFTELFPLILLVLPIYLVFVKISAVLRDQFDRLIVEHEKARIAENEKNHAEMANKAKSMFLANMNHEIRTPLIAISGFTELLTSEELDPNTRREYLGIIQRNTKHLQDLIQDILDLSKIEAGEHRVQISRIDPRLEINTVLESLGPLAREKSLPLIHDIKGNLPNSFQTDPTQLRQILMNIVGNALKFTKSGHVRLESEYRTGESGGRLVFRVTDTGSGIPETMHKKVFDTFSQIRNSDQSHPSGTGLGLALSRKLAQALGGDLKLISSTPGKGSCFEVSLRDLNRDLASIPAPSLVPVSDATTSSSSGKHNARKILVVEDNPDTQVLVKKILEIEGAVPTQAYNGLEAISLLKKQSFDLVLMDLEMPQLNGYDALAKIRELGISVPVVAFTANAVEEVKSRTLALGFDGFQTKPVTREGLLGLLDQYVAAAS